MTQEGFDKLQEELHHLRTVGRAEVSEKIRVARGFGDLSENSEYDEAKNDQAVMEARIAQLEEQLKHVEIIDHDDITTDTVSVGSRVKILDVEYGDEMTYRIYPPWNRAVRARPSPTNRRLAGHCWATRWAKWWMSRLRLAPSASRSWRFPGKEPSVDRCGQKCPHFVLLWEKVGVPCWTNG